MKSQRGFIFLAPLAALACWAPPFPPSKLLPSFLDYAFLWDGGGGEGEKGGLT